MPFHIVLTNQHLRRAFAKNILLLQMPSAPAVVYCSSLPRDEIQKSGDDCPKHILPDFLHIRAACIFQSCPYVFSQNGIKPFWEKSVLSFQTAGIHLAHQLIRKEYKNKQNRQHSNQRTGKIGRVVCRILDLLLESIESQRKCWHIVEI